MKHAAATNGPAISHPASDSELHAQRYSHPKQGRSHSPLKSFQKARIIHANFIIPLFDERIRHATPEFQAGKQTYEPIAPDKKERT
jgi:hypothetical protein